MLTSPLLPKGFPYRLPVPGTIMRLTYSIAPILCVGETVMATPFTHSPSPPNSARQAGNSLTGVTNAMKESAPVPFPASTPTNTGVNIRRGNPGGCYICALPGWSGKCRYVVPMMGSCYSFEDWDFWPDGFGPDLEATCFMHR